MIDKFENERLVMYDTESDGPFFVLARCSKCARFLKHGQLLINGLGDPKLEGWLCKRHGEVMPYDYGYL